MGGYSRQVFRETIEWGAKDLFIESAYFCGLAPSKMYAGTTIDKGWSDQCLSERFFRMRRAVSSMDPAER